MLQGFLYKIIEENGNGGDWEFSFTIGWIENSKILQVHFPEKPIVPGACLLEIARELFEKHFSQKFLVQEVKSIKYLKLIEPTKASVVTFQFIVKEFTENRYKVQIEVLDLKNVFTKLILFFTPITDE